MEKSNINFYTPTKYSSEVQKFSLATAFVERVIRTIREMLYKYEAIYSKSRMLDNLPKIVKSYNAKFHRSIGAAPIDVFTGKVKSVEVNEKLVHDIAIGDWVRLRVRTNIFGKKSRPQWSKRIYKVAARANNTYGIIKPTTKGAPIQVKGRFPYRDLLKIDVAKTRESRQLYREVEDDMPLYVKEDLPELGVAKA